MLYQPSSSGSVFVADAAITTAQMVPPIRVAGINIKDITFNYHSASADPVASPASADSMPWRVLNLCVGPAEMRARARCGSDNTPAALVVLSIAFPYRPQHLHTSTAILGPLTTRYPALVRSLQVLRIESYHDSDSDASEAIGDFGALATHIHELTFFYCGLASLCGLEGRCEYLRKVNLRGCKHLSSLEGLEHHMCLEEVDVSSTAITSIEPLRTCPALVQLLLACCLELSSIEALEGRRFLQVVDLSSTNITAIEPLRTCPALRWVDLTRCRELLSIEGLEDHQQLQEVVLSNTNITSLVPLRSCPAR